MVDGCAGVQTMRMKRVGGYKPYEEQPKREGYVDKGDSVESALKISEMEMWVWMVLCWQCMWR